MRRLKVKTQMSEAVSRKDAKAQSNTGRPLGLRRRLRAACISAHPCVFAPLRKIRFLIVLAAWLSFAGPAILAQSPNATPDPTQNPTLSRYLDQTNGTTADGAVTYAL